MTSLSTANLEGAPDHEVLPDPWTYDIVGLRFMASTAPFGDLELDLRKGDMEITLRFEGVHELEIDAGFPHSCMGLMILDVSHLGWEHARVRVECFEDAPAIRFWAKGVSR
jgi:hypothetical protein